MLRPTGCSPKRRNGGSSWSPWLGCGDRTDLVRTRRTAGRCFAGPDRLSAVSSPLRAVCGEAAAPRRTGVSSACRRMPALPPTRMPPSSSTSAPTTSSAPRSARSSAVRWGAGRRSSASSPPSRCAAWKSPLSSWRSTRIWDRGASRSRAGSPPAPRPWPVPPRPPARGCRSTTPAVPRSARARSPHGAAPRRTRPTPSASAGTAVASRASISRSTGAAPTGQPRGTETESRFLPAGRDRTAIQVLPYSSWRRSQRASSPSSWRPSGVRSRRP